MPGVDMVKNTKLPVQSRAVTLNQAIYNKILTNQTILHLEYRLPFWKENKQTLDPKYKNTAGIWCTVPMSVNSVNSLHIQ